MKVFLILASVAVTLAEPPSYRQFQQNRGTYYIAKQEVESPEAEAPYQPSGWRPDGPAFELPQKQQQQQQQPKPQRQYGAPAAPPQNQYGAPTAPQNQYGAPAAPQKQYGAPATSQQQYGPPKQQYGPPQQVATTESSTVPDFEDQTTLPSTTESQAEPVDSVNELDEEGNVDERQRQSGQYFIALPDGRLQRVQYVSNQDVEAMKYFAKIRAENVEPLRGPIYAYQPLQKLEFAPAQLKIEEPVVPVVNPINQKIISAKLAVQPEPLAAEVSSVPLSSSFTYTANYQVPTEQRYLVTF